MNTVKINGVIVNLDTVASIHWNETYGLQFVHNMPDVIDGFEKINRQIFKPSPAARIAWEVLCEEVSFDFDRMAESNAKMAEDEKLPFDGKPEYIPTDEELARQDDDEAGIIGWFAIDFEDEEQLPFNGQEESRYDVRTRWYETDRLSWGIYDTKEREYFENRYYFDRESAVIIAKQINAWKADDETDSDS